MKIQRGDKTFILADFRDGVHLWVESSEICELSLGVFDKKSEHLFELIEERIIMFEQGYIKCCKCGKFSKYDDIKQNTFYAGIYCDECYNEPRFVEERRNERYD